MACASHAGRMNCQTKRASTRATRTWLHHDAPDVAETLIELRCNGVRSQRMDPRERQRRVGPFLTFRGTGAFDGFTWSFYADLKDDGIYEYIYVEDTEGRTGGFGGGGIGHPEPEPINDRTGRILTGGSSRSGQGIAKQGERLEPNTVYGVLAGPVARVRVELSDGSSADATILPCAENTSIQFFVLVFPSGLKDERIVALDADGGQVDKAPR